MNEVDFELMLVMAVVVVIALAVIYTYRGKFSMKMKKGDAEVSITGENVDTTAAPSPAISQQQASPGNDPNGGWSTSARSESVQMSQPRALPLKTRSATLSKLTSRKRTPEPPTEKDGGEGRSWLGAQEPSARLRQYCTPPVRAVVTT